MRIVALDGPQKTRKGPVRAADLKTYTHTPIERQSALALIKVILHFLTSVMKKVYLLRVEPWIYEKIIKKYGSLVNIFEKDIKAFEREKRKIQKEFKKLRELRGKPPKE